MPSEDTQFSAENQPENKSSRKGIPNAKTVIENLSKMEEVTDSSGNKVSRYVKMIDKLLSKAEGGDLNAIKQVLDRLEGQPKAMIDANINERMLVLHPHKKREEKDD